MAKTKSGQVIIARNIMHFLRVVEMNEQLNNEKLGRTGCVVIQSGLNTRFNREGLRRPNDNHTII
jgi:hypothetical protein